MLSNDLDFTFKQALLIAEQHNHEYATYEHLLLALIDHKEVQKLLFKYKVNIVYFKTKLENHIKAKFASSASGLLKATQNKGVFHKIVHRAALHSQAYGETSLTVLHILSELFFEDTSYAFSCLRDVKLTRNKVLNYIMHHKNITFATNTYNNKSLKIDPTSMIHKKILNKGESKSSQLGVQALKNDNEIEKYCVDLNKEVKINLIDCLIGRNHEMQRTVEILCKRKKNNVILVGEAGVGKTAIAEGLAFRIVKNQVPDLLKDFVIYSLDIPSLVANTKFRGDFEERMKNLLKALKNNKNAILFIDEIHNIIGAGSTTTGALDASNLLKPALARGDIRCIGSTTFKEYNDHFAKDRALVRRFHKITVKEPDVIESFDILQGLKNYYEQHHNVKYDDSALKASISLSQRYINDKHLPDKAIDLIDEAGAKCNINQSTKKQTPIITNKHIEELLSKILDIPQITQDSYELKQLQQLSNNLKSCIFGQDEAINSLCSSINLSRAGLRKLKRPTGCYMFMGSTGVGKTELAKQLANLCHMKLLKFDMSEFLEPNSIAKFLGAPPGYVGFEHEGQLSSGVDKHPYSVVLFDEIEKAHPDIFNILLQIMDDGCITNNFGKKIDFSHTIIILTTNAISKYTNQTMGFNLDYKHINEQRKANIDELRERFSPELIARIDKVIYFNSIDAVMPKIISSHLQELDTQLKQKNIQLKIGKTVQRYLYQKAYTSSDGARKLEKAIDIKIKQPIANEMLFGKLKNGGSIEVAISKKSGKIDFKFASMKKSTKSLEIS